MDRDSRFNDMVFGLTKDEKLKTEVLKAPSDGCEGSKSLGINQVGKDEYPENRPEKKLKIAEDFDSDWDSDSDTDTDGDISYTDGSEPLDYYERLHRAVGIESFTEDDYEFVQGEKFCIHPSGSPISCLSDKCFESTWVGIHGLLSICLVIRRDMDMTRLPVYYQKDSKFHHNMRLIARALISEVECLPHKDVDYYDDNFRQMCLGTVKKPFAVVSVPQGTFEKSGDEDSKPPHCSVQKTINFLESNVHSNVLLTHYGIIRVAIQAYQLTCHKELRAEDIWVSILNQSTGCFDHLPLDIIEDQLAFVNGLSSEKDPEKPLFVYRGLGKDFE